jgi:hypothetical protein
MIKLLALVAGLFITTSLVSFTNDDSAGTQQQLSNISQQPTGTSKSDVTYTFQTIRPGHI